MSGKGFTFPRPVHGSISGGDCAVGGDQFDFYCFHPAIEGGYMVSLGGRRVGSLRIS